MNICPRSALLAASLAVSLLTLPGFTRGANATQPMPMTFGNCMYARSATETLNIRQNYLQREQTIWLAKQVISTREAQETLINSRTVAELKQRLQELQPGFCEALVWGSDPHHGGCNEPDREANPQLCALAAACKAEVIKPGNTAAALVETCKASLTVDQMIEADGFLKAVLEHVKQTEQVLLAAEAERLARMKGATIKGVGLDTHKAAFLAMTSKSHQVWTCEKDLGMPELETCVGELHQKVCETRIDRISKLPFEFCDILVPEDSMLSAELKVVSTIAGGLVRSIVVDFWSGSVMNLSFNMAGEFTDGSNPDADVLGALTEKFGPPVKREPREVLWAGEDLILWLSGDSEGRATVALQRPSLLEANAARAKVIEAQKAQRLEQQAAQKRKDL